MYILLPEEDAEEKEQGGFTEISSRPLCKVSPAFFGFSKFCPFLHFNVISNRPKSLELALQSYRSLVFAYTCMISSSGLSVLQRILAKLHACFTEIAMKFSLSVYEATD